MLGPVSVYFHAMSVNRKKRTAVIHLFGVPDIDIGEAIKTVHTDPLKLDDVLC